MILRSVTIENFKCYAQRTVFNFLPPEPSKGKNIYLIGGRNGTGKTTLLGAIHLCLYGRFESRDGSIRVTQPDDIIEYVHGAYDYQGDRQAISEFIRKKQNDTVRLAVTYQEDETDNQIEIERTWSPRQNRRGRPSIILEFQEELCIRDNGAPLSDWSRDELDKWIEEEVPSGTAQFFFFDGEKVEQFADPDKTSHDLKQALERLLGIETYVNLREHLQRYVVTPIRAESLDKLDGEKMTKQGQIKTLEGEKQDIQANIEETEKELSEVRIEEKKLRTAFDEFSRREGDIPAQRRQQEITARQGQLESQLRQAQEEKKNFLSDTFPYLLLYEELRDLLSESDEIAQEATLQQARDCLEQFVKHLADATQDSGKCPLCNISPLDPGAARKCLTRHIEQVLSSVKPTQTRRLSAPLAPDRTRAISHILKIIENSPFSFANLHTRIVSLREQIEHLEGDKEDLVVRPEAKRRYELLQTQLRNNGADCQRLSDKLDALRQNLSKKEIAINKHHDELDHLEDEYRDKSLQQKVLTLARKVQVVLDEYVDTLRKDRLSGLEKEATRVFQSLLSSAVYNEQKGKIEFNKESYAPIVWLEDSPKDARRISRGIQQLYALSILAGLSRSAHTTIPLVIDTPLSGLDDMNKQCVLDKFFPEAASQVILLSRPDVIGSQNLNILERHVVQKCVLDFDPAMHSTYVRENQYF